MRCDTLLYNKPPTALRSVSSLQSWGHPAGRRWADSGFIEESLSLSGEVLISQNISSDTLFNKGQAGSHAFV